MNEQMRQSVAAWMVEAGVLAELQNSNGHLGSIRVPVNIEWH
jgi:hypothetical protein